MKQHGVEQSTIANNLSVLKKGRNKFHRLIYEMLLIQELKPSLNVQSDSIRAKFNILLTYLHKNEARSNAIE